MQTVTQLTNKFLILFATTIITRITMSFIRLYSQSAHICTTNLFQINIYIILTHMFIASNVVSFCECSKVTSARTLSRPMHSTYPAHLKPNIPVG